MAPEIKTIELSTGVSLQYVEQGNRSGVAVLLLHGLADSWRSFERVLPHLPEAFRTFSLTQRGHGDSSRPDSGYRYRDLAADVAAFIDALDLGAAVIVGHSWGSTIAQRFAIDHPDQTLGLVLIGSFVSLPRSGAPQQLWEVVGDMEDPVDEGFVREFQESVSARPVPQEFLENSIMQESMKLPARVWREVVRCSMQDEFSGELTNIKAPTLLIWGDHDSFVPRSEQDQLQAAIKGSRLLVYKGVGHAILWEEPGRLASDLVTFTEDLVVPDSLRDLLKFPLMHAIFGRRARRFGLGMEIPSGPLAFKSESKPIPLSELEQAVLIAAGTGVSGWSFGVPFSPQQPAAHASATVRFTGRTAPTAAGIGTPVLFYTDDTGTFVTNTRDIQPGRLQQLESKGDAASIMGVCREHTVQLSTSRLDLPAEPRHMLDPNLWMANAPGSTLFMPMGDASEQVLGLLALFVGNRYVIMDDRSKRPAGNLAPFIRSGLLDPSRAFPLSVLEQSAYEANCAELAFMGHNIVLTMQGMGLGGLYYNGLNRFSVMGAFADEGVEGLGFRFVNDERWSVPNPVGIDGVYEALCPPYYKDMRAAVEEFVARKFGPGGAYDPETPGPWKNSAQVKRSATPYSEEFVDCLSEIAQYVYDTNGKFPGTFTTIVLPGFAQAQHLDTAYYDTHFQPGAYLATHTEHMRRWHADGS